MDPPALRLAAAWFLSEGQLSNFFVSIVRRYVESKFLCLKKRMCGKPELDSRSMPLKFSFVLRFSELFGSELSSPLQSPRLRASLSRVTRLAKRSKRLESVARTVKKTFLVCGQG